MSTPADIFVLEGNVEMYLSQLHATLDQEERDGLLRLLVDEFSKMGSSHEHVASGERRVAENLERIEQQRKVVAALPVHEQPSSLERRLLEAFEQVQAFLERHLETLRRRGERGA